MPARCRIDLTEREAWAVLFAMQNSMEDLDDLFADGRDRAACSRAAEKVRRAWRDKFHNEGRTDQ